MRLSLFMTALPSRMTDGKRVSSWSSGQQPWVQHSPSEPGQDTASSSKKGLALTLLIFLIMLTFDNISPPLAFIKGVDWKKKISKIPFSNKNSKRKAGPSL